ncbi:alpha/beta hydrolase domain-containing protein 17c [Anaeramoeba ignava]|uniref:Alpha/beta hydrolase domain-containing protein 17c n=1 Tax=Anaeramoeba ignava TaxID=1746090 RepID=A0A9Q0LJI0_ANAIG|nr:alpha/beta hydrolase domain-containing protein 17c [Anaeramoeba ignava]
MKGNENENENEKENEKEKEKENESENENEKEKDKEKDKDKDKEKDNENEKEFKSEDESDDEKEKEKDDQKKIPKKNNNYGKFPKNTKTNLNKKNSYIFNNNNIDINNSDNQVNNNNNSNNTAYDPNLEIDISNDNEKINKNIENQNQYGIDNQNSNELNEVPLRQHNHMRNSVNNVQETKEPKYTILFSHGNAETIFQLRSWAKEVSINLNANVLLYEYYGYPGAEGKCSERNCYKCAEAAWNYLVTKKKIPPNRIILFGHSLGTGVTIHLATQVKAAGVIIMSPLLSCVRVVVDTKFSWYFDIFCNIDKVKKLDSPTLVIHGESDKIIDSEHGHELYRLLPNPVDPLWIDEAGHNDIVSNFAYEFFPRIEHFFEEIAKNEQN